MFYEGKYSSLYSNAQPTLPSRFGSEVAGIVEESHWV
ncbi:hypothetical protein [Paenibacillus sp. Z3-2]